MWRGVLRRGSCDLLLVDGDHLLFRSLYGQFRGAAPAGDGSSAPPRTPAAEPALFLFLKSLLSYLRRLEPRYACIAFDSEEAYFRRSLYPPYKQTRRGAPEAYRSLKRDLMESVLPLSGLPAPSVPSFEADDLIGSLCARDAGPSVRALIVSGDRDYYQCLSDSVSVYHATKKRVVTAEAFREEFRIDPGQYSLFLALAGDRGDNIPGIPGVGPVGATRLLASTGARTVAELLAALAGSAPIPGVSEALLRKIRIGDRSLRLMHQLTRVRTDVSALPPLAASLVPRPLPAAFLALLQERRFPSLLPSAAAEAPSSFGSPSPSAAVRRAIAISKVA